LRESSLARVGALGLGDPLASRFNAAASSAGIGSGGLRPPVAAVPVLGARGGLTPLSISAIALRTRALNSRAPGRSARAVMRPN
jgi:hypothetical protein